MWLGHIGRREERTSLNTMYIKEMLKEEGLGEDQGRDSWRISERWRSEIGLGKNRI